MKRKFIILLAIAFIMAPALSQAAPFSVLGPRALGMGGASVAAVNDSSAVYWNPAALADFKKVEVRVPVGVALRDHMGIKDISNRINDIYGLVQTNNPAAITEMIGLISDLDKPNNGTDLDSSLGLMVSIPIGNSAIAFSTLGLVYGGIYPTVDTLNVSPAFSAVCPSNFVGCNNTALTGVGIGAVEPTFSFATALGEKVFIGVNAKMVYGSTFVHSEKVTANNFDNFVSNLDASETRNEEASVDAGILIRATETLRVGVVGRYLNSPTFPVQGIFPQKDVPAPGDVTIPVIPERREIELEPQVRVGVAWNPFKNVMISADYDITKNESVGIPGYEDQTAAAGIELTLPAEVISIRGGVYKNMADSDANLVYTAGLGMRVFFFRADLAGAYDFQEQEYQASLDLAFRF